LAVEKEDPKGWQVWTGSSDRSINIVFVPHLYDTSITPDTPDELEAERKKYIVLDPIHLQKSLICICSDEQEERKREEKRKKEADLVKKKREEKLKQSQALPTAGASSANDLKISHDSGNRTPKLEEKKDKRIKEEEKKKEKEEEKRKEKEEEKRKKEEEKKKTKDDKKDKEKDGHARKKSDAAHNKPDSKGELTTEDRKQKGFARNASQLLIKKSASKETVDLEKSAMRDIEEIMKQGKKMTSDNADQVKERLTETLASLWKAFDKDSSGKLESAEQEPLFSALYESLHKKDKKKDKKPEIIAKWKSFFDVDGDGVLTLEEFQNGMLFLRFADTLEKIDFAEDVRNVARHPVTALHKSMPVMFHFDVG
jgi:hypothetical protein